MLGSVPRPRAEATLLTAAAERGAHSFVSDIEQPSPQRDTEAYRRWGELGIAAAYLRTLFVKAAIGQGQATLPAGA